MFSNSVHNIFPVRGFPQARRFFESTRKPPRSKRWEEHQRPLYKVSAPHYRIERFYGETGVEKHYDIVHYRTPLLRYFHPEADGSQVVLVNYYNSLTSRQLIGRMWHSIGYGIASTAGKRLHIPIRRACNHDYTADNGVTVPQGWSALLTYREDGFLDVTRSAHAPVHVFRTSAERKEERSIFFAQIKPYVDVLMMSLSSTHDNATVSRWGSNEYPAPSNLRLALKSFAESDGVMTEALMQSLSDAFKCTYATRWVNWMKGNHETILVTQLSGRGPMPEGMPMLPAELARKAFTTFLQNSMSPVSTGDTKLCLGQFPEKLPRRYYY
jgi:hypothetical protein